MDYLLLLGSLFYSVSGRTSVTPEISTTVLSEFPKTKSETTTSSPDEDSALTTGSIGRTSVHVSPEISTTVFFEFPERKSEPTTRFPDHGNTVTAGKSTPEDCRLPGFLYRGKQRVTKSGILCQRWDVQSPHEHNYFIFRLAQENYCRNFDREEPWCFTSNSSVRWELCGVDICSSPCLNTSFDTQKIASQCVVAEPTGTEFCSRFWRIVGCLKDNIEVSTDIPCSGIELKSIALQRQDMLERLMGRSISQCIKAPCTDPRLATIVGLVQYANPCNLQYPLQRSTLDTLCSNFHRVANCVVSKINDETNSTCLTKDKVSSARQFAALLPQDAANVSLYSPDSPSVVQQDMTGKLDQTQLFILIGSTIVVLFAGILVFTVIITRKMLLKKRRSELLRLPAIPRTEPSPYETKMTFSNDPYNDPNYDFVEEQDDNYEHLPEPREENETTTDKERMNVASYLDPTNLDDTYLEVMHSSNEKSYELINDSVESTTTREKNETPIDKERMSEASYLDPINPESNYMYLKVMQSSNDESNRNVNPYTELIKDSVESTDRTQVNDDVQEN
ncbi:uncharacterized protein LOC134263552 isoform X3 [Saccostrea cucullata]|uniref:uncharacterized protein LOC134263552 isoform X3 n=1 Tax=Saccostrea cuccullata TaxID=36930 RepID=UPI002ED2A37F